MNIYIKNLPATIYVQIKENSMSYLQTLSIDYISFLLLNLILSSVVILLERKNPTAALAWLFFLNLIPGIGFIFYILLSQNISKRKIFKYTEEETNLYKKLLRKQRQLIQKEHYQFQDENAHQLKEMILFHNNLSESVFSQNNTIDFFYDGTKKFNKLFADITAATSTIHIQYYIIQNDVLGNELLQLLEKKSRQGVTVRLIMDHVGCRHITPKQIRSLLASGVEVFHFFPSKLKYFNIRGNYRNHRKMVIIDGEIGYTGGFNVGDEYVSKVKKFGYWRDTHCRIVGDGVQSLQIRFLLDWRNCSNQTISLSRTLFPPSTSTGKTGLQVVSCGPDNLNEQIKQGYLQIIHQAKKYVYIQTPYFIPDESIIEAIKIAAARGVDVRIMIPNKPDHIFVYWATYSYCGQLLPYGVKIYTYDKGFLHAKTIVADDKIASLGTCNFDIRSFKLNFEVNVFIYNVVKSIELKKQFLNDLQVSTNITLKLYEERPFYIHVKEAISRLFSPVL